MSSTDVSVPTFGPSLEFDRTYDSGLAQQEALTGSPGDLGYGWSDNWSPSLSVGATEPGTLYTLDGTGTDSGNTGPATGSPLALPEGEAYISGNLYIADSMNNRVQMIPSTSGTYWGIPMTAGHVYTLAGSPTGVAGASGDGSTAANSLLDRPTGVAADGQGNLYIADAGNNRIEELAAASGTQWGIAMTGGDMYAVAGAASRGAGDSPDGTPSTSSVLDDPTDIKTSHGDLYIADAGNNRIVEVPGGTGTQWGVSMTADDIYRVAGLSGGGTGTAGDGTAGRSGGLKDPTALTVDSNEDVIFTDTGNNRVVELARTSATNWGVAMTADDLYTVAGSVHGTAGYSGDGGTATAAELNTPDSIEELSGGLYIADSGNNRVQTVAGATGSQFGVTMTADHIYTVAGNANGTAGYTGDGGPAAQAELSDPQGVRIDPSGNLMISDSGNNVVRQVNASTADISTVAGTGQPTEDLTQGIPATGASLADPAETTTDSAGNVYIADFSDNRIVEIAATTHTQWGIAMTAGDAYTVAGVSNGGSGSTTAGAVATDYQLNNPVGVALDSAGDLYVANTFSNTILEVPAATGTYWGQSMTGGHIYPIAGTGSCSTSGAGGLASAAGLCGPRQLAMDSAGDLLVVERSNDDVQELAAATHTQWGIAMTANHIYTVAGQAGTSGDSGDGGPATSALLSYPEGLVVGTGSNGNLFIGDTGNNQVREVSANNHTQWGMSMTTGDVYTIAGNTSGTSGTAGDDGAATSGLLNGPQGLSRDTSGDIYIADTGNNRIQEIAGSTGVQWGSMRSDQPMTKSDIYTVAGQGNGTGGFGGDGAYGNANGSLLQAPQDISVGPDGDVYISDGGNDRLRELAAGATPVVPVTPTGSGVTLTESSGAQDTFYAQQASGGCRAPYQLSGNSTSDCALSDVAASLNYNPTANSYTVGYPDGTANTYNSGGQLTAETGAAGDTLTVAYNSPNPGAGNCPSTAANCETITAASGRTLSLGRNSTGEITTVADPMGRTWTYTYSGGDLTAVTDPLGNETSYAYDGTNSNPQLVHDLVAVTKPNGQPGGPDAGAKTVNVYDSLGRVVSQTDPAGWQTSFDYSGYTPATGDGTVVVTDPDGNQTSYVYTAGVLTAQDVGSSTSNDSTLTTYSPDPTTLEDTTTTDPNTNNTTNTYDAAGDITSTTDPLGNTTSASYTTTAGDVEDCSTTAEAAQQCPRSGVSTTLSPPAVVPAGQTITPPSTIPPAGVTYTQIDSDGNTLWTTTGVYQPGASTASYARTTYNLYNGNKVTLGATTISCNTQAPSMSLRCATINADEVVTQLAYNTAGDLTSSSTPDGNSSELATTTYSYNTDGEQTATTSPDGNVTGANAGNYTTTTTYNADGETLTSTQAGGSGATVTPRTTTYAYDGDGNQVTSKDPRGYTTTTAYNADDQPTLVTNPDGDATLTCYDGDGNTTETVPPTGVAANNLTAADCPTSYSAPESVARVATDATTDAYDAQRNKVTETTPAPAGQTGYETTSYTYDGDGNVLKTDAPPNSNSAGAPDDVTVNTYDADGNLTSTTTGSGTSSASTTSYCYDPNGNKTAVVAADGNTTSIAICSNNSPWQATSPYQITYKYDSVFEDVSTTAPATSAAPNGATTTGTYDAAGNQVTLTDPDGVTTTMTYTPDNEVAKRSYSGSTAPGVDYTYDADGQRTQMTDGTGTTTYTHDPFGDLTSQSDGTGSTVTYSYDLDGNVEGIGYPIPSSSSWASSNTVTYSYDHADQLASMTDLEGHTVAVSANPDGLITKETLGQTGDSISTSYDNADNVSSVSLAPTSGNSLASFSYDYSPASSLLTESANPTSSLSSASYETAPSGSLASSQSGTTAAVSYNEDPSGNLGTLPTGATASYNDGNELTSSTEGSTTTTYSFDADGQELSTSGSDGSAYSWYGNGALKTATVGGEYGSSESYRYNGDRLLQSAAGTVARSYTWDTETQLPMLLADGSNYYLYAGRSIPIEQVDTSTGAVQYLVSDALGSVRAIVSVAGTVDGTVSYDTWGAAISTSGTASSPFGFAGEYLDSATSLYYLQSRWYSPQTGQFLSVDPDIASTNQPYEYADDNPSMNADPTGSWCEGIIHWTSHWLLFAVYLNHIYAYVFCTERMAFMEANVWVNFWGTESWGVTWCRGHNTCLVYMTPMIAARWQYAFSWAFVIDDWEYGLSVEMVGGARFLG